MNGFPVGGDGFRSDVIAGQHHLRLFAEVYELGHVAVVYDMNAEHEIARNDADSLNDGTGRRRLHAGSSVQNRSLADFPMLWKDADPDIPILKQARPEYEKLR